jgi:hypothetical protein
LPFLVARVDTTLLARKRSTPLVFTCFLRFFCFSSHPSTWRSTAQWPLQPNAHHGSACERNACTSQANLVHMKCTQQRLLRVNDRSRFKKPPFSLDTKLAKTSPERLPSWISGRASCSARDPHTPTIGPLLAYHSRQYLCMYFFFEIRRVL